MANIYTPTPSSNGDNTLLLKTPKSFEQSYQEYAIKNQEPVDEQGLNKWPSDIKRDFNILYNIFSMFLGKTAIPWDEATLYEIGEIVFYDGKHYVSRNESICIPPKNHTLSELNWRAFDINSITKYNFENVLVKDGTNIFDGVADYSPAARKDIYNIRMDIMDNKFLTQPEIEYANNHGIEIQKTGDGALKTKRAVANSMRLDGKEPGWYASKMQLDDLDKKTVKYDNIINDPNLPFTDKNVVGSKMGKNLDTRLNQQEDFNNLVTYEKDGSFPYKTPSNQPKFTKLGQIIDLIYNNTNTLNNLSINNISDLGPKLKTIDQNITNLNEKTTPIQAINLKDVSAATQKSELERSISGKLARDILTQLEKVKAAIDTGSLDIQNLRDVLNFANNNLKEITKLSNLVSSFEQKLTSHVDVDFKALSSKLTNYISTTNRNNSAIDTRLNSYDIRFLVDSNESIQTWKQLLDYIRKLETSSGSSTNNLEAAKADKSSVYTKTEIDGKINTLTNNKADKTTVYIKSEIDSKINNLNNIKANKTDLNNYVSLVNHSSPVSDNTVVVGGNDKRFAGIYAVDFFGTAMNAKFADLAEYYNADKNYEYGTILMVGGKNEVTEYKENGVIAGVVSKNPGFILNSDSKFEYPVLIALKGRVYVKVVGDVKKGQYINAFSDGCGIASNVKNDTTLGVALEDKLNNKQLVLIKV